MKQLLIKNIFVISALSLISLFFNSCGDNAGLGEAVDLSAPVVTLTSHNDNDSVASTFTLGGTVYDNEEVRSLTVDFEAADLHYSITPGSVWQKKTSDSVWTAMSDTEASCSKSGDTWVWSVYVDTSEKVSTFNSSNYIFSAVAVDTSGNSGKNSKVDCTLIVDENDPLVNVIKPALFTSYTNIDSTSANYALKDGNVLNRLLNGDIPFKIQQSEAQSFKEFRIEFDNGTESWVKRTSDSQTSFSSTADIAQAITGDTSTPTLYYSKTLKTGENGITDLRAMEFSIDDAAWSTSESGISNGLNSGKKIIRVITTSLSPSGAWQRKVVGWFVWWPEADYPWIVNYSGDETDQGENASEIYPGSNISGSAQDDDGIASLTYTIIQYNSTTSSFDTEYDSGSLSLSEENAKYSAWAVTAPTENGNYKLTMKVKDINDLESSTVRYFQTMDVKPPVITFDDNSLKNGDSALNESGDLTFSGNVSDDGKVESLYVVYLNPLLANDAANKIKYMSGTDEDWDEATTDGYQDASGNKVYKIYESSDSASATSSYDFTKTFNIFDDLGIDGTRTLSGQDFIFRALDKGNTKTVKMISLTGDTQAPELTVEKIRLKDSSGNVVFPSSGDWYSFDEGTPTFPVIASGYYAEIYGTWNDNSYELWNNVSKIGNVKIIWNSNEVATASPESNGSWTASVPYSSLPTASGTIKASLTDFGGNTTSKTKSVFIETSTAQLERIGSDTDDGSYNAGKVIKITLEFTKNTTVSKDTPTLTLNNGGTATYSSGSGTAKHIYTYTVGSSVNESTSQLNVTSINANGAEWAEASSGVEFTVSMPSQTLSSRNIIIDTIAPTISSITEISAAGYYKEGSEIILMLEFSEDVTVSSDSNLSDTLKLNFSHYNGTSLASTTAATASGSKFVMFTYQVAAGENSDQLAFNSIYHNGTTIKDAAGNELSDWSCSIASPKNIVIDTTSPSAPEIDPAWSGEVVLDEDGTSFTISGEEGAFIEYTVDGSSWQTYSSSYSSSASVKTISLVNNGDYTIKARQTDKAGNGPVESEAISLTIDKGEVFTALSASTYSGTYSTNTTTKSVTGTITFREAVTIAEDSTVTLNVTRNGIEGLTVPINECVGSDATESKFTFTYTIVDGDSISNNGMLDVTDWSFSTVKLGTKTIDMTYASAVEDGKKFTDNREIYILTGKPAVTGWSLEGEGSDAVLEITFNRNVSKVNGSITFTQDQDEFTVPAVLSTSEYQSLSNSISGLSNYYTAGMNGATLSGSTLSNDTATKYILNYNYAIDNEDLVALFVNAGQNVVTVPIVADAVSVSDNVLTVTLGSAYQLPVMGGTYTVSLPASAVSDEAQNKNVLTSETLTSEGVEVPTIRINKPSQDFTIGATTAASYATQPGSATVRMDCRTPGASIYYASNSTTSTAKNVVNSPQYYDTKTDDASVKTPATEYTAAITLGGNITTYAGATGMKFALSAQAKKGSASSDISYEYATRTVLKLDISGANQSDTNATTTTSIIENGRTLTFAGLKVWVIGGDAPYGGNTLDPFPLSWNDSSSFKLMSGSWTTSNYELLGQWYWVSWDITTNTYHGFVIGDVPSDADTNGPTYWYAAECAWVAQKSNYVLYPGETLVMQILNSGTYQARFLFRSKNEGSR